MLNKDIATRFVALACSFLLVAAASTTQAALVAQWVGDSYTSGDWVDQAAGTPIHATITSDSDDTGTPALGGTYLNGHQVVHFSGNGAFQVASGVSPMSGANDFTIVTVFNTTTAGAGGAGQWYQNTGLVDMEQPGIQNDWGLVLNSTGQVGAGLGNSDKTAYSAGGLADGTAHVAVYTRSGGTISIYTDVNSPVTVTGSGTAARNNNRFTIGKIQTNINHHYTGDLAEVRIYNSALSSADVASLIGNLAATYVSLPTPTARWRAEDLAGGSGTPVSTWTDDIGGSVAGQTTPANQPTIVTDFGTSGHKAVHFDGIDDQLRVLAASNPMAGANDFTLAAVFSSDQGISVSGGANWYQRAGVVDAEQPGVQNDWGLSLSANGTLGAGLGNPDLTLNSISGLNDDNLHIAVYRRDSTSGNLYLTVDGVTTTLGGGSLSARNAADMVFGSLQTNLNYWRGDLAEVQVYNSFLADNQVAALTGTLQQYYTPEPAAWVLLLTSLAGLGLFRLRRRRSAT